jgi:hypothetical protein
MRGERTTARRGLPAEVIAVGLLFAAVGVEIFVTYARLPAHELYHVSESGLAGGAGRVLVFLNFPIALVAIPVLLLLAVPWLAADLGFSFNGVPCWCRRCTAAPCARR